MLTLREKHGEELVLVLNTGELTVPAVMCMASLPPPH